MRMHFRHKTLDESIGFFLSIPSSIPAHTLNKINMTDDWCPSPSKQGFADLYRFHSSASWLLSRMFRCCYPSVTQRKSLPTAIPIATRQSGDSIRKRVRNTQHRLRPLRPVDNYLSTFLNCALLAQKSSLKCWGRSWLRWLYFWQFTIEDQTAQNRATCVRFAANGHSDQESTSSEFWILCNVQRHN